MYPKPYCIYLTFSHEVAPLFIIEKVLNIYFDSPFSPCNLPSRVYGSLPYDLSCPSQPCRSLSLAWETYPRELPYIALLYKISSNRKETMVGG